MEEQIKDKARRLRTGLLDIEEQVRDMMGHSFYKDGEDFLRQHSEMRASTMLAVRHIEDARMRLGKVLQYERDGVAIFDRPKIQEAIEAGEPISDTLRDSPS